MFLAPFEGSGRRRRRRRRRRRCYRLKGKLSLFRSTSLLRHPSSNFRLEDVAQLLMERGG